MDEQELDDVFNDSELSNNIISTPTQSATTNIKSILSKFDSQDLIVNCSSSTCGGGCCSHGGSAICAVTPSVWTVPLTAGNSEAP